MPTPLLLVEDNDDDVFAFRRLMKKAGMGHPLHVATDGQQAIDFLSTVAQSRDPKTLPARVFLDLKLPYRDGLEVLAWIRAQPALRELPVIVLSGSNESRDRHRAEALRAADYLVKPIALEDLRRVVGDKSPQGSLPAVGDAGASREK